MPKLKQKFEVITVDNTDVMLDISYLTKNECLYFNATKMAQHFGKDVRNWIRIEETKEYLNAVFEEYSDSNCGLSAQFKHGGLVHSSSGRSGGTYLHHLIGFAFVRWCSAKLAVKLDKILYERIGEEKSRKEALEEAKTGFRPLTNAVQKAHEKPKGYHFSNEADLFNRIVLGMSAAQYKKEHDISGVSIRSHLNSKQLSIIKELQQIDTYLIKIGDSYNDRKKKLIDFYEQETKPKEISYEDETECTKIPN